MQPHKLMVIIKTQLSKIEKIKISKINPFEITSMVLNSMPTRANKSEIKPFQKN
jgi:hypothetical protein